MEIAAAAIVPRMEEFVPIKCIGGVGLERNVFVPGLTYSISSNMSSF